ncbi:MAP kinase [Mycena pura]|uniref:MAP kinase n=1 Tax=Mycena pura TaxID=153505 RepID=A0AAD6YPK7_9AGAR|nr:MAP kinase [Mycena pura]
MSEAGRRPRRVQLYVANPGSDESDDESPRHYQYSGYRYSPPPLPAAPPPSKLHTNLVQARLPRHPSSHPSSLSSPSSTSSPAADESTPPPSTPGLSAQSLDLTTDPDPPGSDLPDIKHDKTHQFFKSPVNPLPRIPSSRPTPSPTASTPDSFHASSHASTSVVSDRVLILVTVDSERYVNVDISGATNPAFIRERVFSKLNIYDEEEQAHFSIYRTEIGSFAIGEALTDDNLFDLCREFGDDRGSLKLLVSLSSARVHESLSQQPSSLSPTGVSSIVPPYVPFTPASHGPLQPKRRSRSRNGSVSSASEKHLTETSAGYEADQERERERSTVRPNGQTLPGPVNGLVVPNGRAPPRSASPLPSRSSSPLPPMPLYDMFGKLASPPPPPPPLSPNRPTFSVSDDNNVTPPGTVLHARPSPNRATFSDDNVTPPGTVLHTRVMSDPAAEREQSQNVSHQVPEDTSRQWRHRPQQSGRTVSQGRERRHRVKTSQHQSDVEDSPESWVMINHVSRLDDDHPPTPVDSRQSPSSSARAAARQPFSPSRYKPSSSYAGRPLAIPAPPRNAPPPVPATSPDTRVAPARLAGQAVPSQWPVTWKGPDRAEQRSMPTSTATWSRLTKSAKSMDNLRGSALNSHPTTLQPGGGRRPPPLPVSRSTGGGIRDPLSAGTPTTLGTPKSYDGRTIRPLPIQGSSHTSIHDINPAGTSQIGTRPPGSHVTTLMSPNNDPYPRPQSAFGDTLTSPSQRYQRHIQTSGFGSSLEGDYGRSPRAPSPTHPFPTSTAATALPYRSSRPDIRHSDPVHSPVSPRSPRFVSRDRRPGSSSSSIGHSDAVGTPEINTTTNDAAMSDETRWAAQVFSESELPETLTLMPASNGTMLSTRSYDSDSDGNDTGTWKKAPSAERPKSILRGPALTVQIENSNGFKSSTDGAERHPAFATTAPLRPRSTSPSSVPVATSSRAEVRGSTFTARQEATWAPRPPPEDVYERLEDFFPEHDLDKPVIEAISGGTSPTSTDQLIPVPAPPAPTVADKGRIRGKKSIRLVAQERRRYIDRTSRGGDTLTAVQRKRSTKLWGSRVEEVDTSTLPESPSSSDGPTGITFKWVRGELIGRGTYGRVYLALNATTGEMMAVKQVESPRTASDLNDSRQTSVVQALKFESETLKVLDHPNIVQYLGFEETPVNLSIFLEYVPGGSIGSCLHKYGKFEDDVTKSFTSQILAGLEYLHSKGILHRDLKSDNILVETTGVCKISDFGISKRTDDRNDAHTAMQGTVFWMAPEVINTQKKGYNSKIDIWSIGCVVLEMWAGTRPWSGDEMVAVMFKLFQSKQPPPVPEGLKLTPQANDLRLKCFAINPEDRPTAAELRKHPYLTLTPGWVFDGFAVN